MTKKSIMTFGILATSLLLVACNQPKEVTPTQSSNQVANTTNDKMITIEEAKKIAFEKAGVTEKDVKNLVVEEDVDMTSKTFEVDFEANGQEYSFSINQSTGAIVEQGVETSDKTVTTGIDETKAKEAALADAGVKEAEVTNLVVTQDSDEMMVVYEVDFVYNGQEYNYVVDSETANIIEKEVEKAMN